MVTGDAFRQLGAFIDRLEEKNLRVDDISATDGLLDEDGTLRVEVTASLAAIEAITDDCGVAVRARDDSTRPTSIFEVAIPASEGQEERHVEAVENVAPRRTDDQSSAEEDSRDIVDEEDAMDVVDGEDATAAESGPGDQPSAAPGTRTRAEASRTTGDENADLPYYKNEALLAEVYENHDTFAEMTEALGVDVTPATVREHMVNWGIHPDSSTGSEDNSAGLDADDRDRPEIAQADGYGLPGDFSIEDLVDVVVESRTLYDVRTNLGLETNETRELLRDLDLIDLVTSRLASKGRDSVDHEDVRDRIRGATTT